MNALTPLADWQIPASFNVEMSHPLPPSTDWAHARIRVWIVNTNPEHTTYHARFHLVWTTADGKWEPVYGGRTWEESATLPATLTESAELTIIRHILNRDYNHGEGFTLDIQEAEETR